jgi:exodeoxyribonuclease-5
MLTEDQLLDAADVAGNIILVGDPAQLPPVSGKPVLVEGNHDICLTEPHRQGDQLFMVAQQIRHTGHFPHGKGSHYALLKPAGLSMAELYEKSKIICATNLHRVSYNQKIREFLGITHPLPLVDEVVMLFQSHGNIRSDDGSKIVSLHNGREFVVRGVNHAEHTIQLSPLFNPDIRLPWLPFYPDEVSKAQHNQRFDVHQRTLNLDYCYAITCHKAQGSEWDSVVIKDGFAKDRKRWAYTAATRARKELIVI